jgi:hypothetical protein
MITKNLRYTLSAVSLFSTVFAACTGISAAPVRFSQVTQVVNAKPGKANSGNYTKIRLANDPVNDPVKDSDDDNSGNKAPKQDDRVITETTFEIVPADECNCPRVEDKKGFPYWTLLGLADIPIAIILTDDDDPTPTPTPSTPTPTPTGSMTPTPTPTPTETPTPTPTPTETPTKTPTPTPPTEPIPEPMTILLFGTGLAGE